MARIIIVDDDSNFSDLLQESLKKCASTVYHSTYDLLVTVVTTTAEALRSLEENSYELIVVDAIFSQANDYYFIKEVRKKYPLLALPIVVLSAVSSIDMQYLAIRHGASSWYRKSMQIEKIMREILKLIQGN
jgi:CheY-like chemotaxis protein